MFGGNAFKSSALEVRLKLGGPSTESLKVSSYHKYHMLSGWERVTCSVAFPSGPRISSTCFSLALCLSKGSGDTTLKETGSYSTH